MKKELVAVVLAGGRSGRFWPLNSNKVLFPFLGKTFFDVAIKDTLPKEVSKVVIVASPETREQHQSFKLGVPTSTVIQVEPRGMGDALLAAEPELSDCSLLVLNGDDLSDPPVVAAVMRKAKESGASVVIPGWKTPSYFSGGYLVLSGERVKEIVEKPGEGNEPSPYVNMVTHYIEDSDLLFDALHQTKSPKDDLYEQALSSLTKHHTVIAERFDGQFASLKYPWHVLDVLSILLANMPAKGKHVEILSNVVVEGAVVMGNNVKIFENTKIVGPCYIGDNTIIGNNNMIRASHIGANCVTGFNTDITRSYVGDNCWFHSNYVGDSVLEGNISLGSGTVLANLRLDEGDIFSVVKGERLNTKRNKLGAIIAKNVRVGVNTSIMPGVKIGTNSMIGAGVVVDRDIPENTFCYGKTELVMKKNDRSVTQGARDTFRKKI